MSVHKIKTIVIGIVILSFILTVFSGCKQQEIKNSQECIDDKEITNYLIKQNYDITTINNDGNSFTIECKKNNKNISIDFSKNEDNNCSSISIILNNTIEGYTKKYNSIDYEELTEIAELLGIKKIKSNTIKKACEDKRDYYDSSDVDYEPLSNDNKIMNKIYRVGFFENPVIIYELFAGSVYTETVTIIWDGQ